jgi:hypoxanthine phosphoribosyltransferase
MVQVLDLEFIEYIALDKLKDRIAELADEINQEYIDKNPVFLAILNGSFMFISELFQNIKVDCEISFLKVSSYKDQNSTGNIKELIGLNQSIENRHVIVVEDIVDTGKTLHFIKSTLKNNNPLSIKVATLLHKPEATLISNDLDYVGFEIVNKFVVGFGLDYNGFGRNLPAIYIKKE